MGACKFLAAPEICSGRPEQSRRFPRAENRTIHPKFSFFQKLFSNYFLFTIRTETCHVSCFDCNADTYCNTFQEEGGGHKHNRQNRNPISSN